MGKKLNTAQQKAVCHETGPMLVLAGPGSGKTTVLLCRISRLLERGLAKPQEILALTFSKAAAEEMKSRFENLNGASGVSFGTFHSIFFRILLYMIFENPQMHIVYNLKSEPVELLPIF